MRLRVGPRFEPKTSGRELKALPCVPATGGCAAASGTVLVAATSKRATVVCECPAAATAAGRVWS
jgi:hypothetical protein